MSHNFRNQSSSYVKEKEVLEPEGSCEEHIVKRSQSGRQIENTNLSLRKCQSVDGTSKKWKTKNDRRLKTRKLKVPQIPEKIVNIVNILQHENFLEVVDQFFKPTGNKQPRKKSNSKKSNVTKNPNCKIRVPVAAEFDNNTL